MPHRLLVHCALLVALLAPVISAQALTDRAGRAVYVRGMGWSPWHATQGWGRSPEVVAQDWELLRGMHVNTLRPWGPMTPAGVAAAWAEGLYSLPQLGRGKLPTTQYRNGSAAGMPVFGSPEALADIAAQGTQLATALRAEPGLLGYNLGNEYTCTGQDSAQQYVYNGFDPATLAAFRAHLAQRYGEVARLNTAAGTTFGSFAEVVPPTGTNKSLVWWEWWQFRRAEVARFLQAGAAAVAAADPGRPITYARLCGNRWDPITEDLDPVGTVQGDNLYWMWDKAWAPFAVRLARVIGPGRPVLITESGFNTHDLPDPERAARLMRQMLWLAVLHPEVVGTCPFVFSDEWWVGGDPKVQDAAGDHWGVLTADRQPKSTYHAVAAVYGACQQLGDLLTTRQSPPEVLVSDQAVDWWRSGAGPPHAAVAAHFLRQGVSFRLVSLLRPQELLQSACRRLILTDATLPDDLAGHAAWDALRAFVERGGEVLYLCDQPWQSLYRPLDIPPEWRQPGRRAVGAGTLELRSGVTGEQLLAVLGDWLGARPAAPRVATAGEVYHRLLRSGERTWLLLVNVGDAATTVRLGLPQGTPRLLAGDAAGLRQDGADWVIDGLTTAAALELGR
ncbi:MAG: beta-galactosidase [Fimbriimonadaceae bacterium]|nr:beta-galactosidase [Fimbriimonadaceae bacterium]